MQIRLTLAAASLLSTFSAQQGLRAQAAPADLAAEVAAVRAALARSYDGLLPYTWVEHTEVLVKGDLKSSTDLNCNFDKDGYIVKTPLNTGTAADDGSATSKRPRQRKKADQNDYIERALSMIHQYVPPKPDQIDHMLRSGQASLEPGETGASAMRFKEYFQTGDSMVFTYDPATKALLKVTVASTLGGPKDPVTLVAIFQPLTDGVNHMTSATLVAKAKKVEVERTNVDYRKLN